MNFTGRHASSPAASAEYHGLAKKGATCYLNSVLQVLFMTKDFREAVLRHSKDSSQFIDQDLKALFEDLQTHTAETDKIIQKLNIDNVYELRDPAEYFEKVLTLTSPQASQIFRGMLAKKTTCCKCLTKTDTDIPFWHLPLALVDSCTETRASEVYRVVDGIEEFFRPTELNGENQMHCDHCGHKVDATITDVIKHHPDVLLLLPKRFEFSYHYMSYVKINCSVEVPHILHIPKNQTYELYAVVDHSGDMRSGCYSARIKIQDKHEDRWYKFDDTRVTPLDYQQFKVENTEKSESAYLLFYRKKKNAATEEIEEMHTSGSFPPSNTNNSDQGQDAGKEAEEAKIHKNIVVKKKEGYLIKHSNSHAACQGDEGSNNVRQDSGEYAGGTQNIISVTHTSQSVGGVEIRSKEQQNEGDCKQNQSEGNKKLNQRLTEKQGGDRDENIRLESFQPKTRTGIQGVTEGGRHSKQSSARVKVVDEEHTEIPSASKNSSKSKTIIRKTVDETVQDTTKWLESQRNMRRNLNL